jgi:5-methyltetrahydrofolate--homocysteine methyltransferase
MQTDWSAYVPPQPAFTGAMRTIAEPMDVLVRRIDWTPFFRAWDLKGTYPRILEDPVVGAAARDLHADALAMLERIVAERWLTPRAVVGFWPASADGDDIVVHTDESRTGRLATLHTLRQQLARGEGRPNRALADLIAPAASGVPDWIGGFAVTVGHGEHERAAAYEAAGDDYASILFKALADRLAEALAERMHERARTELWGYAPDEALSTQDLIAERYRGIRPAPGYPAQPDHTEKRTLFALLGAEEQIGLSLTDSCAMWPGSSVSGLYFSHPESAYFGVGRIGEDQLADYAARKGWDEEEARRWLAPILEIPPPATLAAAA